MRLAVLLAVTCLAGCLGSQEPDPASPDAPTHTPGDYALLLCVDGPGHLDGTIDRCNHRVTKPLGDSTQFDWTSQHGPGNEVSIAVDPTNPLNAIGGAKDYTVSYISDEAGCGTYTVWMGTFWSHDGGVTWGNDLMPGFPGDPRGGPLTGNACNTDPVLVFDDDGTAWYHALNYRGSREDADPFLGESTTGSQLYFARSPDKGETYPADGISFASIGDNELVFNDKNWMALQPGGDHMIATWSNFITVAGTVGSPVIMFTESFDGETWSAPREIPAGSTNNVFSVQFSMPQYLDASTVAVIWADFSNAAGRMGAGSTAAVAYTEGIVTPAGTVFRPSTAVCSMNPLKTGENRDGTGPSRFRVSTYPVLAVDTSGGEFDGRRYVVWADQPGPIDSDVGLRMCASDDGLTWTPMAGPEDVRDGDQFMPWIDVDADGGIHVAWYDRRNDPDNRLLDVYYAHSPDGGTTWTPNVRVTETNFDGDLGLHQSGAPFIGDYIGVDAAGGLAYVFWADTRHTGEPGRLTGSDVYSATVLRDASTWSTYAGTANNS